MRHGRAALALAVGVGFATASARAAFLWPSSSRTFDLAPGTVTSYNLHDGVPVVSLDGSLVSNRVFHIVRLPDGEIRALSSKDPHLGCAVPWRPDFEFVNETGFFRDPCHLETFDMAGDRVYGPATRGLDRFAVTIENDRVVVDLSDMTLGSRSPAPPLSGATATPQATAPAATATTEPFPPAIAPDGRTPDAALNTLIEGLLSDDAGTLEGRFADVEASDSGGEVTENRAVPTSEWTAHLAGAQRSLYTVTTGHPRASPPRDVDVMLSVSIDGKREGWRFSIDSCQLIRVVMLDRPSAVGVAKSFERFIVLSPLEDLAQPTPGYKLRAVRPRTGDADVDQLLASLWARDRRGAWGGGTCRPRATCWSSYASPRRTTSS